MKNKRVRKEEQLRERTVPVTPDRGVYEQALRIPLQHPSGRSGIPRTELIPFYFNPINKRVLNSIALDAQAEGIPLWDRDISRYIYSNRIPVFNPLEDFLYHLPVWDGKDRIRGLAQTVPCENKHWVDLFHRWFLNMVMHWRGTDKKYANNVSPLLVGPQGCRKSTFCRSLIPPAMRAYYTDSIDFSRKTDAELYLNRFALINIDEFDQISATQQGYLKHILQNRL